MKRAVLGALCAIAFAASASAAELRIAFVDVKAAIENTKEYQQGIAQLKAFQARQEKELEALQKRIEQAERELEKKRVVMSVEQVTAKEQEIASLRKQFDRKREDAQEELSRRKMQLDMRMMAKFRKVLERYAKQKRYDFVFGRPVLLYAAPQHEITAEITKLMDAER